MCSLSVKQGAGSASAPSFPLASAGRISPFEEISSFPATQTKSLSKEEVIRTLQVLSTDNIQYKQTITYKEPKELSFTFSLPRLLQSFYDRLLSYKVLQGMYIKGGANKPIYTDNTEDPFDKDFFIQISDWRNEKELDRIILSCFAHAAGITCDDRMGKDKTTRMYFKEGKVFLEITPAPDKAPDFARHHECGHFFLQNGLGNYCKIKDSRLYTIHATHNGKPCKFDIHIVKNLDHHCFCSQNAIYTAIHPLFKANAEARSRGTAVNLQEVPLWAKTVDGYSMDMALDHIKTKQFCYDPPSRAAELREGLHIHHRLLAKGNNCLNKGIEGAFQKQFVSQYFESVEGKSKSESPVIEYRLHKKVLKQCLEAELAEHLQNDPKEQICFLLNLIDYHINQRTPCLQEVLDVHYELLLRILGEKTKGPRDLVLFFHLARVHAFLYNQNNPKNLYLQIPFESIRAVLTHPEALKENEELLQALCKHLPIDVKDPSSYYKEALLKIFAASSGTLMQQPAAFNPMNSIRSFFHFYPAFVAMGMQEKADEHFRFLLKMKKPDLSSVSLAEKEALKAVIASKDFDRLLAVLKKCVKQKEVKERFKEFAPLFSTEKLMEAFLPALSSLQSRELSVLFQNADCNPFASPSSFFEMYDALARCETSERAARHFLFVLKNNKKGTSFPIEKLEETAAKILNSEISATLRNEIVALLDAQYGFAKIENSPRLKELTFALISKGLKMYQRALSIYQSLLANGAEDKILVELMEKLFASPFSIFPDSFSESLRLLRASCTKSESLLVAHLPYVQKAMGIFKTNEFSFKEMWELIKSFCVSFREKGAVHGHVNKLVLSLADHLGYFKGLKGIEHRTTVVLEGMAFAYLEKELVSTLPALTDALFGVWKENPQRAFEIYLSLEGALLKLPMSEFAKIFQKLLGFCPLNGSKEEALLMRSLERMEKSGAAMEPVRKRLEETETLKRFSSIRERFAPLVAAKEVPKAEEKKSEKKQTKEKEKQKASQGEKKPDKSVAAEKEKTKEASAPLKKEQEDLIALFKSTDDLRSISDVEKILKSLLKFNLESLPSLRFLEKNCSLAFDRIYTYFCKAEQTQVFKDFEIVWDLISKVNDRIEQLLEKFKEKQEVPPPLLINHASLVDTFRLKMHFLEAVKRNRMPDEFFELHVEGMKSYLSIKDAVQIWQDASGLVLNELCGASRLDDLFTQKYKTADLDPSHLFLLQKIFIEQLLKEFAKTPDLEMIRIVLKEIHILLNMSYPDGDNVAEENLRQVYEMIVNAAEACENWLKTDKLEPHIRILINSQESMLLLMLNGELYPENRKLWISKLTKERYIPLEQKMLAVANSSILRDEKGDLGKAEVHLKLADQYLLEAIAEDKKGNLDASKYNIKLAYSCFLNAHRIDPNNLDAILGMKEACRKIGEPAYWKGAIPVLLHGATKLLTSDASLITSLALAYHYGSGEMEEAIKYYKLAIQADEECIEAYGFLSRAYQKIKDLPKAIDILREAIAKFPKEMLLYEARSFHFLNAHRYEECRKDLLKILSMTPRDEIEKKVQQNAKAALQGLVAGCQVVALAKRKGKRVPLVVVVKKKNENKKS